MTKSLLEPDSSKNTRKSSTSALYFIILCSFVWMRTGTVWNSLLQPALWNMRISIWKEQTFRKSREFLDFLITFDRLKGTKVFAKLRIELFLRLTSEQHEDLKGIWFSKNSGLDLYYQDSWCTSDRQRYSGSEITCVFEHPTSASMSVKVDRKI